MNLQYNYWLLGVHKERRNTYGYRILNFAQKKVMDVNIDNLKAALANSPAMFGNIGLDQGEIVGTQGSLDRYTAIRGSRAEGKSLVILAKITYNNGDTFGYIVTDYRFSFCSVTPTEKIIDACINPLKLKIANGTIVDNGTTKFIRPIQGEYQVIVGENLPQFKPAQKAQDTTKQIAPAPKVAQKPKTVEAITVDGFEYRYGYELDQEGKWIESGLDGFGAKFVGTNTVDEKGKPVEDYILKPKAVVNNKPVLSIANTFRNTKSVLIDLRGMNEGLRMTDAFINSKMAWVFVDNNICKKFSDLTHKCDVTIVSGRCADLENAAISTKTKIVQFKHASVDDMYNDILSKKTKGKGLGVIICGKCG